MAGRAPGRIPGRVGGGARWSAPGPRLYAGRARATTRRFAEDCAHHEDGVSRLRTASGEPFATCEAPWETRFALADDRLTRLFVQVEVEGQPTSAVVDTGGAYFILHPAIAAK